MLAIKAIAPMTSGSSRLRRCSHASARNAGENGAVLKAARQYSRTAPAASVMIRGTRRNTSTQVSRPSVARVTSSAPPVNTAANVGHRRRGLARGRKTPPPPASPPCQISRRNRVASNR
jgi:hypothetical protein